MKKKYRVYGYTTVSLSMLVEADSPEDAKDEAALSWPGLTGYVGNGATGGRLLGPHVDDSDPSIESDGSEPTWNDAQEET
jgi:hypothetical protein